MIAYLWIELLIVFHFSIKLYHCVISVYEANCFIYLLVFCFLIYSSIFGLLIHSIIQLEIGLFVEVIIYRSSDYMYAVMQLLIALLRKRGRWRGERKRERERGHV